MKWSLGKNDRDEKLESLILEGEHFDCKIWATIMLTDKNLIKKTWYLGAFAGVAGALSNQYCYMGICNKKLYVSVIKTFDVKTESYNFAIPFEDIDKVVLKGGVLPKRKVMYIYNANRDKMKIAIMLNAIGSDIDDQEKNALKFFDLMESINKK